MPIVTDYQRPTPVSAYAAQIKEELDGLLSAADGTVTAFEVPGKDYRKVIVEFQKAANEAGKTARNIQTTHSAVQGEGATRTARNGDVIDLSAEPTDDATSTVYFTLTPQNKRGKAAEAPAENVEPATPKGK